MAGQVGSEQITAPDPQRIATAQDFGRELTAARTLARMTVRQVARTAGLPISTVGDYFSGRHLPGHSQSDQVLKLLQACGETDPARLAQWADALDRARRPPGRRVLGDAPYRGLARFEREDARWFFGREEIIDRLAELVEVATDRSGEGLPLVLVGPSGSGKSSLLRAGLLARLEQPFVIVEPAADPVNALHTQLAGLSGDGGLGEAAIIVDQFESVFTHCRDKAQRSAFIAEICEIAAGGGRAVLALRSDFYEQALRYPVLARALQARQVVLGPMTAGQVRRAIVEPARLARLDVEDGLVDLLLRDLAPPVTDASGPLEPGAYEPGALPLLSHAMLATWEHSRGGVLSIAGYLSSGGIREALARTAEGAYADLPEQERRLARRLFLRLVHVADNARPTRASVAVSELRGLGGADVEDVLGRFVDERLITVDEQTARITHDALLAAWPRLRSWIEDGMDDIRTRRRVTEAARAWQDAGCENAALWRGSQLAVAREWAADEDNRASLGSLAAEFVAAAVEAEQARERAARRITRRLRRLVAALTALVVAVCGLAGYAFQQRLVAGAARDNAESRQIALEAGQLRGQDPPLAAQLSVAAYGVARTPQATAALLESSGAPAAARLIDSAGVVESVSLSPDRKLLAAAAADGTLRLWNVAAPGRPVPVGGLLEKASATPLYTAAFSPDGKILAAAGAARTISLWDVSRPGHPIRLGKPLTGPTNTVYSVAFSPDGKTLAVGSADNTVRLYDISDLLHPALLGRPLTGAKGYVQSVAFSADGRMLAAGSADHTVRLWNIADPAHPESASAPLTGPASIVTAVAFSPDGRLLAAACQDHKVWLWRIRPASGTRAARARPDGMLSGAANWLNAVAFSPDGTALAAGSSDSAVLVWNVATRALTATLPQPQPVTSLAWDGQTRLAAGDADGTVSLWDLPTPVLLTGSASFAAVFSPNGKTLAVTTLDGLQLWSVASRKLLATQAPAGGASVAAVEFAPHGNVLAVGGSDGMVRLWRATRTLTPLSPPLRASAAGSAETVAFSPDGGLLATGGDDGTLRLWSVRDPAHPQLLATAHDSRTYVFGVAFAPDGKTLAAASADNLTRLWDVTNPARPVLLGHPLAGPSSYALSVAFSPDSRLLAVGAADKTVQLWNVANPERATPASVPLTGPTGYIYSVTFSPGGKTLAAAVTDGSAWLWNVATPADPTLLATLTGPTGHTYSVAFSPSGTQLAAASADGTVRLWDTNPAAAARAVCANIGQPLTRQEWATYVPGPPYTTVCRG